jgi:hypothetical protein
MSNYSDTTNLANALKYVYGEGLKNQFNDEHIAYNLFPKTDKAPRGKGYVFGVRMMRNQSTGGRAESSKLPDPMTGVKVQGTINPAYIYGSIRITGPLVEAAKGNEAAFVDGLADEIEDIYTSLVDDLNRQTHWDGFGQIGRLSSAATVPSGTWAGTFSNDLAVRYFNEGMLVDFYDSAGATVPGSSATAVYGQRVSSVKPSTGVVIFESNSLATQWATNHPTLSTLTNGAASTMPAGCIAVKLGSRKLSHASSDTAYEMTGLYGMFDDATLLAVYEGITVASYPKWAANILSNSSVNRELSIDLMLQACDVSRATGGGKIKKMMMGMGQKRKYVNLLLPDVRFQPTKLQGGYEVLSFAAGDGSVELIVDPDCQPNLIYAWDDDIYKYEMSPLGWGNLDHSQLHQRSGYDEWDAFLRIYTWLGTEQRNNKCLIKDLVEPSLYS